MPIAYWCLLIAALMPFPLVPVARKAAGNFNNATPRDFAAKATGLAKRAYGAHLNSMESFPFFAAAVLVAMQNGMDGDILDGLALTWVGLRLVYVWAYLSDRPGLRSPVWGCGILLAAAIMTMPAWSMLLPA